jgi:uncharacterized membrane protein
VSVEWVGSLGASLTVSGGSLWLSLVLLLGTVTYPAKGGTRHIQTPRKASAEVPNPSKGEMCSNYYLSICFYVSAIIHHPARGAGSAGATLLDLQRSWTFSSCTLWILDGDRWWPLLEILAVTPRGPPSMSPTSVVAAVGPAASNPQRVCH